MFLVRMTGLIALAVATTTLQASVRPVPKPAAPAQPDQPKPAAPQIPQTDKLQNKQELMIVLAPSTSVWSDSGNDRHLDGSGPAPAPSKATSGFNKPVFDPAGIRQVQDLCLAQPALQVTRAWMTARYPNAPPREC